RFVGLGKDILEQVVRILVIRGHVIDQAVQARGVFHHQLIEGAGIPILGTRDQLLIFIGSWLVHCPSFSFNIRAGNRRQQIRDSTRRSENGTHFFQWTRRLTPVAHREEPEQIPERGDEGSDVSERGGVEHIVYPGDLSSRLHNPHLLQNYFGPTRGV